MASIWRHPNSPFWTTCFTVHGPTETARWKRGAKTSDRKLANRVAEAFEEAGRGSFGEKEIVSFLQSIDDLRTRKAAQKTFHDVFRIVAGREIGAGSLKAFSSSWLQALQPQIAGTSFPKYKRAVTEFIEFIGQAADRDLIGFGNRDDILVIQFRDHLRARLSASSVNDALKIVRQMFKSAAERFKIENPAALVRNIKKDPEAGDRRRAFTVSELGRILRVVQGSEWEGIVLFGLYTGQRLSDIARVRWENVDLVQSELALTTRKTHRRVLVPLAEPLHDYLLSIAAPDSPLAFIFPKAADCLARSKTGTAGGLSNQFHDILARAGLVRRRTHRKAKDGVGRSARRNPSQISFHSFRHTATSLLKNAGVPQSVVMDIIGHESRAVSQIYTHVGDAEKRRAIATLPTLKNLLKAGRRLRPDSKARVDGGRKSKDKAP